MAVGSKCKPVDGQVGDLSTIGAALATGVLITGEYRLYIGPGQLMRKAGTVNAWTTLLAGTVNAWTTWAIHSFLGITWPLMAFALQTTSAPLSH